MADSKDNTGFPHAAGWAFFSGGEFGRRLDLLRHLAQSSQLLLLVVGPQGSGKTTLLNELLTRAEHYWRACRVQATADMDAAALFGQLARCTDLPTDCGEQALMLLLIEHAANLEHASQIPVVMVDDAHLLSASARAALVRLGRPGPQNPHPWHVLLFGQTGVEADIDEADRHTVQLGPLSPDQLGAYVHHRLGAAGFGQPVGTETVRRLYKASHGLPGQLEPLLGDLMRAPATTPQPPPPEPTPAQVQAPTAGRRRLYLRAGAAAAVVVALGALLAFQDRINALFQGNPESEPAPSATRTVQAPVPLPAVPLTPAPLTPPVPAEEAHTPPPAASTPVASAPAEPPAPAAAPAQTPAATAAAAPSAPSPEPPQTAASQPSTGGAGATPAEKPAMAEVAAPSPSPAPEPAAEPEPPKAEAAAPAAAPAPAPAKPPSPPRAGRDWVLAQDPHAYTLQLLGSRDEATVRKAMRGGKLGDDAHYYRIEYRGRDWYVLVYGAFADHTQATRAARKLPAQAGAGKPWIRRLRAVQEEVRRGHK